MAGARTTCGYGSLWSSPLAATYLTRLVSPATTPAADWMEAKLACNFYIEADVGVPQDIAHFYFVQLISGLSWMHGQGIAHRGQSSSCLFPAG